MELDYQKYGHRAAAARVRWHLMLPSLNALP